MEASLFASCDHAEHDYKWLICQFDQNEPRCLACLIELLGDHNLIIARKKLVLSELLRLISREFPVLKCLLNNDLRIAHHLIALLLDLTKIDKEALTSMAIEGCVKLLASLECEELLEKVLRKITHECVQYKRLEDCLPQLIVIGRLLHEIPALSQRLLQDYGEFIDDVGTSLCGIDDDTLSASVYIFSYLFKCEDGYQFLPERLCLQVEHAVLYHLRAAKSQNHTINLLGLLKRLLADESRCHAMMSLTVSGTTLCSVIRRLLISPSDVYQMAAVQCIQQVMHGQHIVTHAQIILDADIAEFLFEIVNKVTCPHLEATLNCLISLADVEQFFSRCHSLYGVESLLRALDAGLKQRLTCTVKPGFKLLSLFLERQPEKLALLNSCSLVDTCLDIVHRGILHHDYSVIISAISSFALLMRRNHLHAPIPFAKLMEILGSVCQRVKGLHKLPDASDKGLGRQAPVMQAQKKMDVLKLFYTVNLAASKLAASCEGVPMLYAENFTTPDLHGTGCPNSLEVFCEAIHDVCDDYCIPMIMMNWSSIERADIFTVFYQLLDELMMSQCKSRGHSMQDQLVSSGFLSSTTRIKAHFRCNVELRLAANIYLRGLLMHLCQQHNINLSDDDIEEGLDLMTDTAANTIKTVVPSNQDPHLHATLLLIVHMCYIHEDFFLTEDEITHYIGLYLSQDVSINYIPISLWKCFTFLIAVSHEQFGLDINPINLQELLTIMSNQLQEGEGLQDRPAGSLGAARNSYHRDLFLDHPITIRWSYSTQHLANSCAPIVMLNYLRNIAVKDNDSDAENVSSSKFITFSPILFELLPNAFFRTSIQTLLTSVTESRIKSSLISFLHQAFIAMPQSCDWSRDVLEWYRTTLPSVFLSDLLRNDADIEDCLFDMLPLLELLRESSTVILPQELKILSAAISQLTKAGDVSEHIQIACMRYISLYYHRDAVDSTMKRVSSMLLQNTRFLKKLECFMKSRGTLSCLASRVILNLMLNVGPDNEPPVPINLSSNIITTTLLSDDRTLQLSTVHFFITYFSTHTNGEPQLVIFDTNSQSPSGLPTVDTIMTIWTCLQQACLQMLDDEFREAILQDAEEMRDAAMTCMESLIASQSATIDALVSNSWNAFLLECLLRSHPLAYSLRFVTVLARDANVVQAKIFDVILETYATTGEDINMDVHAHVHRLLANVPDCVKNTISYKKAVAKLEQHSSTLRGDRNIE